MKKKNPLVILLCVLAGLGLLYGSLATIKANNERAKADAEAERLAVLSFEGAGEIRYNYGAGDLTFKRTDEGGWVCGEHASWPIDQNALDTLAYDLGALKAVRVLDEHGGAAEYGLDEPEYTIHITDAQGGSHTLMMSAAEDVNGNRYAAVEGDERVFTISSSLADALAKDLLDYIDYEQLPHPAEDDITAVTLTQGADSWVYTREETADGSQSSEAETQHSWSCLKNGEPKEAVFENVQSAIYSLAQLSFSSCAAY